MFGKIFGSDKAIEGLYNGVDKAWFTEEEKSDYMLKFLKAYEPFKVTQRFLAILYSVPFVSFGSYGLATGDTELVNNSVSLFGTPATIILSFYFAGGMLEGAIKAKVKQ